jgi:hypothetical protein
VYRKAKGDWKLTHYHADLSDALVEILKRPSDAAWTSEPGWGGRHLQSPMLRQERRLNSAHKRCIPIWPNVADGELSLDDGGGLGPAPVERVHCWIMELPRPRTAVL